MRPHPGLKPQDCLVLLQIVNWGDRDWLAKDLAASVGLSPAEVSFSLERSRFSRLIDESKRRVNTGLLLDFLVYGLKVVFPVRPSGMVRGVPTAWSAPPLASVIRAADPVVWSCEEGRMRGLAIEPLFPSVPKVALRDEGLHELLALTDALRIGRAREIELARKILKERFDAYAFAES